MPRLRNTKKPSYPNGVDVRANLVPGERAKPRADCSTRLLKPVLFVQQKAGVRKVTKKDADYERLAGQLAEKEVPEKNDDLAVGTRARIRKTTLNLSVHSRSRDSVGRCSFNHQAKLQQFALAIQRNRGS